MHSYFKAWFTLEGIFLWLVPIIVLLLHNQALIGIQIEASASNGWGRVLAHPWVSATHLVVAVLILLMAGLKSRTAGLICFILSVLAVCLGLYSAWSPGLMATSFPLTIGGLFVVLKGRLSKPVGATD